MAKTSIFSLAALSLGVIAAATFIMTKQATVAESLNGTEPAAGEVVDAVEEAGGGSIAPTEHVQEEAQADDAALNVEAVLSERVLGDPNAPIRITEHSSFTCGHCGNFHRASLPEVKEKLIDTGKAYIVFSDFPLNAPALHASIITRCAPQDKYFEFVDALFAEQDQWAFEADYIKFLQKKGEEYGLSTERIKECLSNDAISSGIIGRMTANKTQFKIGSTPSFVVNNKVVISGALTPEIFIQKVNEATQ
ncbi:MAG: thioredoxin domain-containing protein [Pseudomonadota bacterium]